MTNSQPGPKFGTPLPQHQNTTSPAPYTASLTPQPSPLRPHCLAWDRLRLWRPASPPPQANTHTDEAVSKDQLDRILQVINSAWAELTKTSYGVGLLVFHVYCDLQDVLEEQRCLVSPTLLLAFLCSCAGSYSSRLVPPSSKCATREPFTPDLISCFRSLLNLNDLFDVAVFACITTCFWAIARLGELMVSNIKSFDVLKHVIIANDSKAVDRDGNQVTKFYIPITKM